MDFPDKHYNIIYADPPWQYRQKGGPKGKRGVAAAHYDTMTTEEICALPVQKLCGGGTLYAFSGRRSQTWRRLCGSCGPGALSTAPPPLCG